MINKNDLLSKLKAFKEDFLADNSPKDNTRLDKNALSKLLADSNQSTPKTPAVSKFLNFVPKNENLATKQWTPKTNMVDIHKKLLMESTQDNSFRLNIQPLVLDKMHGKFKITRGGDVVLFELLYPNANKKLSVKFELSGVEDRVLEVGLESEAYTKNFANFIIKNADEMLVEKRNKAPEFDPYEMDSEEAIAGKVYSSPSLVTGHAPLWESIIMEADAKDEDEEDEEDLPPDLSAFGDVKDEEVSEPNAEEEFTEEDFSLNPGESRIGGFDSDFGGGGSFSDSEGSVNKDEDSVNVKEDAPEYIEFREKSDWLNDSLNSMQRLIAKDTSEKMKSGSGVVLTQNEILNGLPGIKGDQNFEIVDKFLTIYPELDGVPITVDMMNQIEDKLALDDEQFDSWLQQKLPEITGTEEVNETLNNEMFEDFKPMGTEEELPELPEEGEGSVDKNQTLENFLTDLKENKETKSEEDQELIEDAEEKVDKKILDEFPNLS